MHRSLCICALVPRIATRTRVLVVLHQLEAPKPTNTGVLAARCLTNSGVVHRGRAASAGGTLLDVEVHADVEPVVLFPHPDASPLERWRGSPRPVLLVVPDGTWSQAARARRRVGELARMPCALLPAPERASLRLRAPPRSDRMATLEAIALALEILEGAEVGTPLMHLYRVMTERTLWTNGRMSAAEVTGGIPPGVRSHDPLGGPCDEDGA